MKQRQYTALIAPLLSLLLLSAPLLLTSCGTVIWHGKPSETTAVQTTSNTETEAHTTETQGESTDSPSRAKEWLSTLPSYDFENAAIVIASTGADYVPQDIATEIDVALYERNRRAEQKCNMTVVERKASSPEALREELTASLASGLFYADVLMLPSGSVATFAKQDLLVNINSIPFFDTDRDWFDRDAVAQLSAGYQTYALYGALTNDPQHLYACFFNRALATARNIPSLYEIVSSGSWTNDLLLVCCRSVPDDMIGLSSYLSQDALTNAFFLATGQQYLKTGVGTLPTPTFAGEQTDLLVEQLRSLFESYNTENQEEALNSFYAGKSLFIISPLYLSGWILDMEDAWGILPVPKTSDAQTQYYTPTNTSAEVAAIPNNNQDIDRVGPFLQTMFAASGDLNDAYLNDYTDRYLRDDASIHMLEIILQNPRLDFACMFGASYNAIPKATASLLRNAVYQNGTVTDSYGNQLERLNRQMEEVFGHLE